jgi:protein-tyrosine-phosphatase
MAEAWANHFGKDQVQAFSAGTHPIGIVVADTVEAMDEKGISLYGKRSKGLRDVPVAEMDFLVVMGLDVPCEAPAGFKGRKIEWGVPDPYSRGMDTFRNVRDMIERHVLALLAEVVEPPNPPEV